MKIDITHFIGACNLSDLQVGDITKDLMQDKKHSSKKYIDCKKGKEGRYTKSAEGLLRHFMEDKLKNMPHN